MNGFGVLAADVPVLFEKVEPFIERALSYGRGEYLMDDIYKFLLERDMQLWIVHETGIIKSVLITEITSFPRKKVCRVVLMAGSDMDDWMPLLPRLEEWAKFQECDYLEGIVRPGLRRKLARHGFRHTHEVIHKDLSPDAIGTIQ